MKKTLLIIGAILVIILLAFFVWFFVARDKSIPAGEAIKDILPFGSGGNLEGTFPSNQEFIVDEDDLLMFDDRGVPITNLFRISNTPVAGSVVFSRAGQVVVRYVDRATGHIYEVRLPSNSSSTPLEKVKITNNTLPKIYEAYFRPDGNAVLLRSLRNDSDVVENVSLTLTPPTSTSTDPVNTVAVANFRSDIGSIAVGSGNTLFYSLKNSNSIASSPFDNPTIRNIPTSTFTDWKVFTFGNNLILQTRSSANVSGFAYSLNTANGLLSKILGPLTALSVTPNTRGTRVFYSYKDSNFTRSSVLNTQSGVSVPLSPATLAEKCIWSRVNTNNVVCAVPVEPVGASSPDDWYQGITSFYDRVWLFDTNAEIAQVLIEPRAVFGLDLDIIDLKLSPNEDYLIFTNKTDMSLWALKLQ